MPFSMGRVAEASVWDMLDVVSLDQRQNRRTPFFRPVTMTVDDAPRSRFSAFSRDISVSGIGLLHSVPLETMSMTLRFPTIADHQIELKAEVRWTWPCGDGWHLSGGEFVDVSASQAAALWLVDRAEQFSQRLKQSVPFFRPITLVADDAPNCRLSAFSREVSPTGIGLLHSMPLETAGVTLRIPTKDGEQVDVPTEIRSCQPAGEGWFLSEGRFEN